MQSDMPILEKIYILSIKTEVSFDILYSMKVYIDIDAFDFVLRVLSGHIWNIIAQLYLLVYLLHDDQISIEDQFH